MKDKRKTIAIRRARMMKIMRNHYFSDQFSPEQNSFSFPMQNSGLRESM